MNHYQRAALLILDGWGHGPNPQRSALAQAHTPNLKAAYERSQGLELLTHGGLVGLPEGQMGNSEVGHLNLGAGRIVYQELARINRAIETNELASNTKLQALFQYCLAQNRPLHLFGLFSNGGVHSHIEHLKALCLLAQEAGLTRICVHAFTDGRDCDPHSGLGFVQDFQQFSAGKNFRISSLIGRYYAMDRDRRWERSQLAYNLLTQGQGQASQDPIAAVKNAYEQGLSDEFLPAFIFHPEDCIQDGDGVLSFNFRTDRCRQIVQVLSQEAQGDMQPLAHIKLVTMTRYDESFKGVDVLFEKDNLQNTLGEVLSKANLSQLRMAETEKYPHVTFFFSGGREAPFPGESRLLCPSPKVATYDLQPEMSAPALTDALLAELDKNQPNFICLNYANADMVGHTGVFQAAIQAAEAVDACLGRLLPRLEALGYAVLIVADHGNSDYMINDDGTPNTAHTTNPVPCRLLNPLNLPLNLQLEAGTRGKLADVAPTLLELLGLEAPAEMTGQVLWKRQS